MRAPLARPDLVLSPPMGSPPSQTCVLLYACTGRSRCPQENARCPETYGAPAARGRHVRMRVPELRVGAQVGAHSSGLGMCMSPLGLARVRARCPHGPGVFARAGHSQVSWRILLLFDLFPALRHWAPAHVSMCCPAYPCLRMSWRTCSGMFTHVRTRACPWHRSPCVSAGSQAVLSPTKGFFPLPSRSRYGCCL